MTKTVGECFNQIRNGVNIKQGVVAGGFPITRIETIANDEFNRDRMGYAGITDLTKYESYLLEDGDLLMSHINSVQYLGRTVLYEKQGNEKIIHGMNLLGLRANLSIVNPAFARYIFCSPKFRKKLSRITKKSVNQASFTVADLKKIEIDVPVLEEQAYIVENLDKTRQIITLRKKEIEILDELTRARFVEMFRDEKNRMSMSDICSIITDGTHQPPKFRDTGIPFIFVSNITGNKVTYDAEKFIDQDTYDELIKRTPIEMGDVLLSTVGSYGHPAVVKSNKKFLFQRHIAYLKPRREIIDSDYLHGAILSPDAQRQIEEGVKGIAQKTLNLSEIKKMRIPVPDMNRQKEFATFVAQIEKSKALIKKALDEVQLLFDSLMQHYFG